MGAVDWDRRLFDSLIPLPDGTSYNAYLVKGSEKTALIDTVDPTMEDVLFHNIEGVPVIDYVVAHHGEQDHSGSIPAVLKKYPAARVVCTPKAKGILADLLPIPEDKFVTVEDGETISLGDRTLKFIHTPWVHWPETMVTYLVEEKILFSCDLFGSHLATSDLYVTDEASVYEPAKRYYAEIMMPFRHVIPQNIDKLKDLLIQVIAPSHGPLYGRPEFIVNAYREWSTGDPKNVAVVAYVTMHGSTEAMVDYLVNALADRGVTVEQYNLPVTDLGTLAMSLVDAATVIIGTPTVLTGAHPAAVYAAYLANALRPKTRFAGIVGSYSWGGRAVEQVKGMLTNLKVELFEPVIAKGRPKSADFEALDSLADAVAAKHKEHKLV